jgi:hypothetical protein
MSYTSPTTIEPKTESIPPKNIRGVLYRRSDLSTFVVHLTRDEEHKSAKDKLKSITRDWTIRAKSPFGAAVKTLNAKQMSTNSQECVCFTETPLEYIHLMTAEIIERDYTFKNYGIAMTKKMARKNGVNPVWYTDITPGHDWLMKPINALIDEAVKSGNFCDSEIAKITPFIEQMGDNRPTGGDLKEFWWEREWRHAGDFELPNHVITICPEDDFSEFEDLVQEQQGFKPKCINPNWGLEKIIARLAGFNDGDIDIL